MARTKPDPLADDDRARLRELHARLGPDLATMAAKLAEQLPASEKRIAEWLTEGLLGGTDRRDIKSSPHAVLVAIGAMREAYDERIAALYPPVEARRMLTAVNRMLDAELAGLIRHGAGEVDRVVALQTLSAGLAHEVRNPLNAAKLQLELLERRLAREVGESKLVEPLAVAQHELERLTRLLGEFLAFARPSELDLGEHDVVELAREVAGEVSPAVEVEGNGPAIARVDAVKLRQILQNVVRNAIEAGARRVVVRVTGDEQALYVLVVDNGPGIPVAIRNRVFEPFFTTKPDGTGLGMSIVHSMVSLHGGTIELESSTAGTRCEIALPRR